MTNKPQPPEDPEMQAFLQVIEAAYAEQERRVGKVDILPEDGSLQSTVWNAIVLGYPNRIQDMRETTSFAREVVCRLTDNGHLPEIIGTHASPMISAFLRFLWDRQNLMYLDPKFALGQARALEALIGDINMHWSPPDDAAWFPQVSGFAVEVDESLARIQAQTYETVYDILRPVIEELGQRAASILAAIEGEFPDALPAATAYVCGILIERNSFSPLDGSVPEDIGEAMDSAYFQVDRDNEQRYLPYLRHGFDSVNDETDELDRWRIEDA